MELNNKMACLPEELAAMETRKLRSLLQNELQKDQRAIDTELVNLLLQELERRDRGPEPADDAAMEEACERFRRETTSGTKRRPAWYKSTFMKVASVVLVVGLLVALLPRQAQAETLADVLTRWTDSIFHFFDAGEPAYSAEEYVFQTDNPDLQQIYDKVTELGITDPVVPTWLPDGFTLKEMEVYEFAGDKIAAVQLTNSENFIYYTIILHGDEVSLQHEKDEQNVDTIDLAGIEHYMMSNLNERIVTWMINGVECSIATDCKEEELRELLKSIYTLED